MKARKYPTRIALCGFAGSGKSSIAPILAARLGYDFVDTDRAISKREKSTIPDLFRTIGEVSFRKKEAETVRALLKRSSLVIALGGGALIDTKLAEEIAQKTLLIYLVCSRRELARRLRGQLDRPLLNESSVPLDLRISQLFQNRVDGYLMAALKVSTTKRSVRQTSSHILKKLEEYGNQ